MADAKVTRGLRAARCEFSKRGIEIGRADLRMTHGTLHIRGTISVMRGIVIKDLRAEVEIVGRVLRQKPDIKDVVVDCNFHG